MPHQISIFSRKKLLYIHGSTALLYARGKLFYRDEQGERYLCDCIDSTVKKNAARIRLAERILRLEPRVCVPLPQQQFLISAKGAVYCLDVQTGTLHREHTYRPGMSGPLQICRTEEPQPQYYYGDYFQNPGKAPASIYRRTTGGKWETVYTFAQGEVNHIHAIVDDPWRDQLIILTGDEGNAAGIWFASRDFSRVQPVCIGSQMYRSCVLFPMEEGLLYATDAPNEPNHVFFASLDAAGSITNVQTVADLPGSCIYGLRKQGKILLATCVETDPTLTGVRYLLSQKRGSAILTDSVQLLSVTHSGGCFRVQTVAALRKDIWPMGLCQFGNLQFPPQDDAGTIYACPTAVKKYDGMTLCIQPAPSDE